MKLNRCPTYIMEIFGLGSTLYGQITLIFDLGSSL